MALMHGKQGRIEWDCGAVRTQLTLAQSWTCDVTHDVAEITSMGDTWKTYAGGYRDWNATAECLLDTGGPIITPYGQGDPNGFADTKAYLELYLEYDTTNDEWRMVHGYAVCNGIAIGTEKDSIATITYTFQGVGILMWDSESVALHVY